MELFRTLADEGKTIVVVSHDESALRACDEILRIDN